MRDFVFMFVAASFGAVIGWIAAKRTMRGDEDYGEVFGFEQARKKQARGAGSEPHDIPPMVHRDIRDGEAAKSVSELEPWARPFTGGGDYGD